MAADTGLSIATVSRVLNGQANVAPRTREVVLDAVGRLGGQGPRIRTDPGAIDVRCAYLLDEYFVPMVSPLV